MKKINCPEAEKLFNDFIDDYLQGKRKQELLDHLKSCQECFNRLEFEKILKTKISSVKQSNFSISRENLNHMKDLLLKKYNRL